MLSASASWGQNMLPKSLIGTPDEYQDYFVFNKFGNLNVAYWLVEINEVIVNEDSTRQNQLREIVRVTDRNFLKLDEKYVNIPLFVEVKGFTNTGTLVAQDEWEWQPIPYDVPYWKALCSATCVGPTYSYTINVQAEYDADHNRTTNNQHHLAIGYDPTQGTIGNFGGNPSGIWRNFDDGNKADFCQLGNEPGGLNDPLNTFDNINAPMHHGLQWCPEANYGQWDGVNFMFISGSNNNGFTFHEHDGTLIPAGQNVWRVRKGLGKWGEFADNLTSGTHLLYSDGLLPAPETSCGKKFMEGKEGNPMPSLWSVRIMFTTSCSRTRVLLAIVPQPKKEQKTS